MSHCKVCHKLLYPHVKKVRGFDGLTTDVKNSIINDLKSTTPNGLKKLYTLKAIAEKYKIKESTLHSWKSSIAAYVQGPQ